MKKETIKKADELCRLLGFSKWQKWSRRCGGKWAGTFDNGLEFDGGQKFFVSNGMDFFHECLSKTVDKLNFIVENKQSLIDILTHFQERDNEIARKEGIFEYKVKDLIFKLSHDFLMVGPIIEVNGKDYIVIETGSRYALEEGNLEATRSQFEKAYICETWTACSIDDSEADFVYHNVRFSTKKPIYIEEI